MARRGRRPKESGGEYTTARLYRADALELSELAKLSGRNTADLYRDLCAPLLRRKLIDAAARRVEQLRQGA